MRYCFYYRTEIGLICIEETDQKISHIYFENETVDEFTEVVETSAIRNCYLQIEEYLKGTRKYFSVPLLIEGTDFQKDVYEQLQQIPYGKTVSYQDIAVKLGMSRGARAVGNANNKNPLPILVPCHRVIGKDGSLTGYAGGLEIKKKLLNREGIEIDL